MVKTNLSHDAFNDTVLVWTWLLLIVWMFIKMKYKFLFYEHENAGRAIKFLEHLTN